MLLAEEEEKSKKKECERILHSLSPRGHLYFCFWPTFDKYVEKKKEITQVLIPVKLVKDISKVFLLGFFFSSLFYFHEKLS